MDNKLVSCLGYTVISIGTIVYATLVSGLVLAVLWGWFMVPIFKLPELTMMQAVGIGYVVSYMTQRVDMSSKDEENSIGMKLVLIPPGEFTVFIATDYLEKLSARNGGTAAQQPRPGVAGDAGGRGHGGGRGAVREGLPAVPEDPMQVLDEAQEEGQVKALALVLALHDGDEPLPMGVRVVCRPPYDGFNPLPPQFCYLKPHYLDVQASYFDHLAQGAL